MDIETCHAPTCLICAASWDGSKQRWARKLSSKHANYLPRSSAFNSADSRLATNCAGAFCGDENRVSEMNSEIPGGRNIDASVYRQFVLSPAD